MPSGSAAAALVLEVEQRLAAAFDESESRALEQSERRMQLLREHLTASSSSSHSTGSLLTCRLSSIAP